MFEIERKFRLTSEQYDELLNLLTAELGEASAQNQNDIIYLENGKNFGNHKSGEPIMRLRDQNGKQFFTYKKTVLETGNRIEHETIVESSSAIDGIIRELNWQEAIRFDKQRLEFKGPDFTYALDRLSQLTDSFFEIEYVSATDNPNAEELLFTEAARLGLDPETQVERRNYAKLVYEERIK